MQSVSKLAVFLTKTQPRNSSSNGSKLVTGCYKQQFLLPLAPAPSPPPSPEHVQLRPHFTGTPLCTHVQKRMHSSRMRTARSSSHWGGPDQFPLNFPSGVDLDQIPLNFPLGCGPGPDPPQLWCGSGPDPPQLPPWLLAWTRPPSTSPLVVGLDQIPLNCPLGCGPGPSPPQLPPWLWAWRPPPGTRHTPAGPGPPPWIEFLTQASENITLHQTSFAGGNEARTVDKRAVGVPLECFLVIINGSTRPTYFHLDMSKSSI